MLHDRGGDGASAARSVDQRDVDVPRSGVLPGVSAGRHSDVAHLPVHPRCGTPAVRRAKRSTRWPSCSRRRTCCDRRRIYATDINDAVLKQARTASSRSIACRNTPRTTSARAGGGRSPSTTRRSTTARCSVVAHAQRRCSRSTTSSPIARSVSQRHLLPERAHLFRPRSPASRPYAVLSEPRDVRDSRSREVRSPFALPVRGLLSKSSVRGKSCIGRSRSRGIRHRRRRNVLGRAGSAPGADRRAPG